MTDMLRKDFLLTKKKTNNHETGINHESQITDSLALITESDAADDTAKLTKGVYCYAMGYFDPMPETLPDDAALIAKGAWWYENQKTNALTVIDMAKTQLAGLRDMVAVDGDYSTVERAEFAKSVNDMNTLTAGS